MFLSFKMFDKRIKKFLKMNIFVGLFCILLPLVLSKNCDEIEFINKHTPTFDTLCPDHGNQYFMWNKSVSPQFVIKSVPELLIQLNLHGNFSETRTTIEIYILQFQPQNTSFCEVILYINIFQNTVSNKVDDYILGQLQINKPNTDDDPVLDLNLVSLWVLFDLANQIRSIWVTYRNNTEILQGVNSPNHFKSLSEPSYYRIVFNFISNKYFNYDLRFNGTEVCNYDTTLLFLSVGIGASCLVLLLISGVLSYLFCFQKKKSVNKNKYESVELEVFSPNHCNKSSDQAGSNQTQEAIISSPDLNDEESNEKEDIDRCVESDPMLSKNPFEQ